MAKRVGKLLDGDGGLLLRGSAIALLIKAGGVASVFLFNISIGRLAGPKGAGEFYLALSVMTLAAVLGRFGLDNVVMRFVAQSAADERPDRIGGIAKTGLRIVTIVSVIAATGLFLLAKPIANRLLSDPGTMDNIRLMSLAVVPFAVFTFYAQLLKGLKRVLYSQLVQSFALHVGALAALWLGYTVWHEAAIELSYLTGTVLCALLGVLLWRKARPSIGVTEHAHVAPTEFFAASVPLLWASLLNVLIDWMAPFLLGVWRDAAEVGVFTVALRTALLTSFVLMAVNTIAAPRFAELYRSGDKDGLTRTARQAIGMMLAAALPIFLLFVLAPGTILGIFGPEFRSGATLLVILSAGQFVNVATGSVGALLMMTGYERALRNNVMMAAILNILLCVVLIPAYGAIGAAVAVAVTVAVKNLVALVLVHRLVGLSIFPALRPHRVPEEAAEGAAGEPDGRSSS